MAARFARFVSSTPDRYPAIIGRLIAMATTRRQSGDFLPLARHEPLLRALLATDAAAAPAAMQWLEAIDFDVIDVAEQRLMPFFDSRLRALALDHPAKGKIRGLYRRAWYVEHVRRQNIWRRSGRRLAECGLRPG
jgi:hypothetical protein